MAQKLSRPKDRLTVDSEGSERATSDNIHLPEEGHSDSSDEHVEPITHESMVTEWTYGATIYQSSPVFPPNLGYELSRLSELMNNASLFLIIQGARGGEVPYWASTLTEEIADHIIEQRNLLPTDRPLVVVIDSHGGDARGAYRISSILQRRCSGYLAVIPRLAKSAATFLAFGADGIILGDYGELGPLDVQVREDFSEPPESALNEVESVQRLFTDVLEAVDQTMVLLYPRLGMRRAEQVLPYAIELVTETMRPLLEKVDTRLFTKRSRDLKVGEDYAARLLSGRYEWAAAMAIANIFVRGYADHGFIIDHRETLRIVESAQMAVSGIVQHELPPLTLEPPPEISGTLDRLHLMMNGFTAIGLFTKEEQNGPERAESVSANVV